MPSLSHRSSLLFRRHSSTSLVTDSEVDTEPEISPSKIDPFQSNPSFPLPTVRERPIRPDRRQPTPTKSKSDLSRKQTLLESKSTPTPKIVLASPSTSTIHYLFPGDNSSSHLSAVPFDSRLPRYTGPSGSDNSTRKRLSRRSLEYDYAPVIESGSSRRSSRPVSRTQSKHSPKDSLDYTKGLKTRESLDVKNGLKHLGRGQPSTRVTPTTVTVLGPTKRVPSIGSETIKRESIGTRLKLAASTPAPHAPTTSISLRTINPISPSVPGIIKKAQSMRTIRRQPSLADLGRKIKKAESRMPALMERENHVEMPTPAGPAGTRKRLHSLSSERRSRLPRPIVTAPTTPVVLPPGPGSPVLPPPDLGDSPLVTLPQSPSFSHLDYSTAGSSAPSRRNSITRSSRTFRQTYASRNLDSIYTNRDAQSPGRSYVPVSASMSRGATRLGLGAYDSAKQVAKDDLERRLAARDEERGRTLEKLTRGQSSMSGSTHSTTTRPRRFSLRWSQSLKRPTQTKEASRARSQSLSAKSVRLMGISPPVPLREGAEKKERPMSEAGRGIYLGDLNVDLGGRFLLEASLFPSDTDKSPSSSLYPDTTPSSGYSSLPQSTDLDSSFPNTAQPPQNEFPSRLERRDSIRSEKYRGRPLHPAFASSTSLLAPSTIGLGFSPIATPVSLPESLMDEAIDLTGRGWAKKEKNERSGSMEDVTTTLRNTFTQQSINQESAHPSRPNQFFLPSSYPHSLRMTKSLGAGVLRDSYFAKEDKAPIRPARSPSRGPPTPRKEQGDTATSTANSNIEDGQSVSKTRTTPRAPVRIIPMSSTFTLCSPPDAIDPLPPLPPHGTELRQLRTNKSSPFLSASASLRGLFRRDRSPGTPNGTVEARVAPNVTTGTTNSQAVKYRGRVISSPMDLDSPVLISERSAKSYGALGGGPRQPRAPDPQQEDSQDKERARRERILSAALSQSLRSKRDVTPASPSDPGDLPRRMVQSASKSRMAIPTALLASAPIDCEHRGDECRPERLDPLSTCSPALSLDPSPDLTEDPSSPPRQPRPFSPQISKWSPSPIKPKRRRLKALVRSPSIPSLSLPLHSARSMISLHKAKDSITLSFGKGANDSMTNDVEDEHDVNHDGLTVVYESPRRSLSAEQDRQIIAHDLGSPPDSSSLLDVFSPLERQPRPGTPRRLRGSTLPSGLSLTPRSERTKNPNVGTLPLPYGRSGKWWTSTGLVADRARRFFSPELGSESTTTRRSTTSKPDRDPVRPNNGAVSSTDPSVRKVLEELIQREEDERARAQSEVNEVPEVYDGENGEEEGDETSSRAEDVTVDAPMEVKRQSRSLSRSTSRVSRAQKVMDWCEAVDGTKDLRDMEERWKAHVNEERERMRRIGERKV